MGVFTGMRPVMCRLISKSIETPREQFLSASKESFDKANAQVEDQKGTGNQL